MKDVRNIIITALLSAVLTGGAAYLVLGSRVMTRTEATDLRDDLQEVATSVNLLQNTLDAYGMSIEAIAKERVEP